MANCPPIRAALLFRTVFLLPALFLIAAANLLGGDAPAFDLAGPKVDVHVQREGKTLPIAEVPNLLAGDRLWIHPDLPESQSAHYVLIVAFLRGSTNPPPADWFRRVETWNRDVREEGIFVVVPAEAQQALIFLAPETTGDFSTLRKAVQGRPGAFVRATQDLQQASWDRLRLDAYLGEVKGLPANDPKILKERTEVAARALGIRVDQQCFDKPTEQQAPCLIQHTDGLVLDDSNAQSFVNQMANGSAGDIVNQLSYSSPFGAGAFSPYVGAVLDVARIFSSLHTAKFQYIPALALPQRDRRDTLNLRLNVPPSFRDPKSVIVVALPPIGPSHTPQLHSEEAVLHPTPGGNPAQHAGDHGNDHGNEHASDSEKGPEKGPASGPVAYCATKPDLALSAEGSPLVFATALAHDLTLHIETTAKPVAGEPQPEPGHPLLLPAEAGKLAGQTAVPAAGNTAGNSAVQGAGLGKTPVSAGSPEQAAVRAETGIDVPVNPDATQGGFVLAGQLPLLPESEVTAELRGKWGFDAWSGPKFRLVAPHPGAWTIPSSDQNALITGREDQLHIQGESTLCVEDVHASAPDLNDQKIAWKSAKPDQLEVSVPLKEAGPGTVTVTIHQYGLPKPEELRLKAYAEAAAIEHLSLSAGDKVAVLKGKRLDEVESADLAGITFAPAALNRVQDFDQLDLSATGVTSTLKPGKDYSAKVTLRDGRTLHVPASVGAARPQIDLLSKGVQQDQADNDSIVNPVHLGSPNDLPLSRRLVFFLRSRVPASFARSTKVELAAVDNPDGSFKTMLSFADGSLMLEDNHTAVAVIDPMARFGPSAFGPLQLRAVNADGVTGDWVPVGTLVRLPGFGVPSNSIQNSALPGGQGSGQTGGPAGGQAGMQVAATKPLRCPRSLSKPCQLTGTNLFLITEVSASPDMSNAVDVPPEFTGTALTVPNTARASATGPVGTLYLRLRDDPETVQTLSLPVATPAATTASAETRQENQTSSSSALNVQPLAMQPPPMQPSGAAKSEQAVPIDQAPSAPQK